MIIRQNIFANIVGRAWGFISIYAFVPLYLKFLGIEAFGLVGFYSTFLGVLAFADMGFTATLNREMARLSVLSDSAEKMRNLVRTYEVTYGYITILLSFLIWFLAPLISEHWLRSNVLQPQEIITAIQLMGIAIAFQLLSGLYIGGLMGLQRQVQANYLQISWGAFRGVGGVVVLWLLSPTIFAFALWQLITNVIYFFNTRRSLWSALSISPAQSRPRFKWQVFRNTWRYAAGMAGMTVISNLLTQTDKLGVSKMLPLEMLGYYTLAGTLALVPLVLASPIALAVFPRFTELVTLGDRDAITRLYHRACELIAVAIIPTGLTIAMFSGDFIVIWTGSFEAAQYAGPVASFLIVGQLMQGITVAPYYLALAHGNIKLNLQIGVVSVILIIPLLIFLVKEYGLVGAAISWLIINLCTMPPYMYYLHRRFLPGEIRRWCIRSVSLPLFAALPWVLIGRWLIPHSDSRLLMFGMIMLVWSAATLATVLIYPELRKATLAGVNKILRNSYA